MHRFLVIMTVAATILAYGFSLGMLERVLTPWWMPATIAVLLALLTGVWLRGRWSRLTRSDIGWLNWAVHLVVATGLFLLLMLGLNMVDPGREAPHTEQLAIERRYRTEHYRSRRVGRGRYTVTGETYYRYHVDVRLTDGRTKSLNVPLTQYNNLRRADSVAVDVRPGLLGMPVMSHIRPADPH